MRRQLTHNEITAIEAALALAHEEYVKISLNPKEPPRLAQQFDRQALQAKKLRELFSDYPTVTVDDEEGRHVQG